jgi:TRAP transporter TAXI family solute receptor
MKNKKLKLITVLCLIITLLGLTACGGSSEGSQEGSSETLRLTMATGGTGGTYYPFGGALAQAIDSATGYIRVNVNATGASAENVQQIGAGHAHLAIVQNDVMDYAYNATNTWTSDAVTNMSTLMSLYHEVCQLVVSVESGINSVADLAGKRVSTGDIGSGVEANATQILEAYGLSVGDIRQEHLSFSASADAMKDNAIDAFFVTAGAPTTAIMDLQMARNIKIINLDDDKIDALIAKYPFYSKVTLGSSDYSFLDVPANTVAVKATLIANPDLDEQAAYDIVKAIIESKDQITLAHAKGEFISPEGAVEGISVDFHPGALRYFEEIGALY